MECFFNRCTPGRVGPLEIFKANSLPLPLFEDVPMLRVHLKHGGKANAETRLVPSFGKSLQMSMALIQPVPLLAANPTHLRVLDVWDSLKHIFHTLI